MKNEDSNMLLIILDSILVIAAIVIMTICISKYTIRLEIKQYVPTIIRDTVYVEVPSQWDAMIAALIDVESNGNPMAVNETSGASGILQIMPIYVKDVNRIIGEERYTLDDRFSPDKSMEMFMIVQSHYNPERDIEKAIRMHNPGGGDWYYNKVKNRMI